MCKSSKVRNLIWVPTQQQEQQFVWQELSQWNLTKLKHVSIVGVEESTSERKTTVILGPVWLGWPVWLGRSLWDLSSINPAMLMALDHMHLATSSSGLALTLLMLLLSFFLSQDSRAEDVETSCCSQLIPEYVGRKNVKDRKKCTVKHRCLLDLWCEE
jgi:hypothetical protein